MNKIKISEQINKDVNNGIYNQWQSLKDKLIYLSAKLIKSNFIKNCDLNNKDYKLLKENDYIL